MKKRMFLSTILMTLVLLLAVTTATFAWYQAQAGSVAYTNNTDSDNSLKTVANSYVTGSFEVTVELGTPSGAPVLTNADGETYYYAGAVNGAEIKDTDAGAKSGSCAFTVKVTYGGSGLTDAEIADLWTQLGESVTVTISDNSGYSNGAGLKFWEDAAHQSAWADGEATATFTFEKTALTFNGSVATIGTGTVYYGAKGVDDLAQTPSDVYVMLATVAKTA